MLTHTDVRRRAHLALIVRARRPRDGDGDGFYSPAKGLPDKTPVPPKPPRITEAQQRDLAAATPQTRKAYLDARHAGMNDTAARKATGLKRTPRPKKAPMPPPKPQVPQWASDVIAALRVEPNPRLRRQMLRKLTPDRRRNLLAFLAPSLRIPTNARDPWVLERLVLAFGDPLYVP